jgi:tetratricopeptide (TPR) repeat protein
MHQRNLTQQLQHAFKLFQQGKHSQAEQLGRIVLAQHPGHPDALNLVGQVEHARGQLENAQQLYRRGLKIAPTHLPLLNNAGRLEKARKNFRQSEAYFQKALKIDPAFYYARQNLAILYQEQRKFSKAKRIYAEVIRQQPQFADALANLSIILEKEHDLEQAESCARRALQVSPTHRVARLTLANIAIRNEAFEQVIELLNPLLSSPRISPMDKALMAGKCAFAHEKLGHYEAAFDYYQNANSLLYQHYEPAMRKPGLMYSPEAFRAVERAISDFDFASEYNSSRCPVFLVGFPRSGTTLLDQILSSHSQISVLEEKPTLNDAFKQFPATDEGLRALQSAREPQLNKLRRAYWANLKREMASGKPPAIIVDKLPLNIFALLHINRLFPSAKIIVALRDPRDCVFSGFQQKFGMNAAMFQLLKLETAATFYDQVMNIVAGVEDAGALAMHFIRYEKVIQSFECEVGALIRFLGLEWEDSLFDYQATAKARDIITPSAPQVIQPLYTSSIGKWSHYEKWIGSKFGPLDKWVERWGYSE